MSIFVTCKECGREYEVPDDKAGLRLRCRNCGTLVPVPLESAPAGRSSRKRTESSGARWRIPTLTLPVLISGAAICAMGLIAVLLLFFRGDEKTAPQQVADRKTTEETPATQKKTSPAVKAQERLAEYQQQLEKRRLENRKALEKRRERARRFLRTRKAEVAEKKTEEDALTAALRQAKAYLSGQAGEEENRTEQFISTLRAVTEKLPEISISTETGRVDWVPLPLNASGIGLDAFRFRSPLEEPADMHCIAVFEQPILACQVFPVRGAPRILDEQSFVEVDLQIETESFPDRNVVTFDRRAGGQIQPGEEYILWVESHGKEPFEVQLAAHLAPAGTIEEPADAREFAGSLGIAWQRADYKAIPEELKPALRAARLVQYYGSTGSENFKRIVRSITPLAQEIKIASGDEPPQWQHFKLNSAGAGLDLLRFTSPLDQPADLNWIFVVPSGVTWYILPVEGSMKGFKGYDEAANIQVEGTELPFDNEAIYQTLRGGEIKPGREYLIWFSELGPDPLDMHLIMDLSPAGSKPLDDDIRIVTRNLGVRYQESPSMPVYGSVPGVYRFIGDVCFSPQGDFLAANDETFDVSLWDPISLERIVKLKFNEDTPRYAPDRIAVSADGRYLAAANQMAAGFGRIWDTKSHELVMSFDDRRDIGYDMVFSSLAFRPDKKTVVATGLAYTDYGAPRAYEILLWNFENKPEVTVLESNGYTSGLVVLTKDGRQLITIVRNRTTTSKTTGQDEHHYALAIRDIETAKITDAFEIGTTHPNSMAISPDGKYVALGYLGSNLSGLVEIWDWRREQLVTGLTGKRLESIAFSPDSRYLAFGTEGSTLGVFDIKENRMHNSWCGASGKIYDLSFSPDGRFLAFVGQDGVHRLWEWNTFPTYEAPKKSLDGAEPQPAVTNSIGMTLNLIPAGRFRMGTPDSFKSIFPEGLRGLTGVREDFSAERPYHVVTFPKPFYIGRYEVTVGQFRRFVEATGYKTTAETSGKGGAHIFDPQRYLEFRPNLNWQNPGIEQEDDHPVVQVTYEDATAFCRWLSQKEGLTYRLPTEAEWEYCCRAGSDKPWHQSDRRQPLIGNVADASLKEQYGRYYAATWNDGFPYTAPVGSFFPNAFGLYDMHGNVFEWCADWYDAKYYLYSPPVDPQGPDSGTMRVQRGGAWSHYITGSSRSACRDYDKPDDRSSLLGFRIVLEIE